MPVPVIALLGVGDMGAAIGGLLRRAGVEVVTDSNGRSAASLQRIAASGLRAVQGDDALLRDATIVLSILPPAVALETARRLAGVMKAMAAPPLFADCNAVSPATVAEIGRLITGAGAVFVDGGIIGGPPRDGKYPPRLCVSGPRLDDMIGLRAFGLDIRVVSDRVGDASALKMCYASLSKGTVALAAQAHIAAVKLGVSEAFAAEIASSLAGLDSFAERMVPTMPAKSARWVAEMHEIAATLQSAGLPPQSFEGFAALYDLISRQPPGAGKTRADVVAALAGSIPAPS